MSRVKNYLLVLSVFICLSGMAQKINVSQVPEPVLSKFKMLYPDAKNVTWEKEELNYKCLCTFHGVNIAVRLDEKGNLLEKQTEINVTELPVKVYGYVLNHYPGKKISKALKIEDGEGKTTCMAETVDADLFFDPEGNLLRKKDK